ncbi:MAG: ABC transporter permease subunit [Acetobacteraceae bacterium]
MAVGAELHYVQMSASVIALVHTLGTDQPSRRAFIFGLPVAIVIATYLLRFRTRFGMRVRAVTQSPELAKCFGITLTRAS